MLYLLSFFNSCVNIVFYYESWILISGILLLLLMIGGIAGSAYGIVHYEDSDIPFTYYGFITLTAFMGIYTLELYHCVERDKNRDGFTFASRIQ